MSTFITLSCPNCGAKLQLTQDIDRFACAYCGQEHLVQRGNGVVSLKPVLAKLDAIQYATAVGTDTTRHIAAEIVLSRLNKEMDDNTKGFAAALSFVTMGFIVGDLLGWSNNVIALALLVLGVLAILGSIANWKSLSTQISKQRSILARKLP